MGFPCVSTGKESACNAGDLGWEDPLEKGKATHSSVLAWGVVKSGTRLSVSHFTHQYGLNVCILLQNSYIDA